jgi:hypothetical protein
MPATLFYAFEGQIGVLLISWFGKADTIAEVGALSRIPQISVLLGAFNTVGRDTETIRRYIADQEKEDQRLDQLEMPCIEQQTNANQKN